MAAVMLLGRPLALLTRSVLANQMIAANVANRIRRQSPWHVLRQGWSFFHNDFAGRIATRVMQTGPALHESVVASAQAVWYLGVYGIGSVVMKASFEPVLTLPMLVWLVFHVALLRSFVPRLRDRSKATSGKRSMVTGRIVDTCTNILTVKLFPRVADQDAFVRSGIDQHTATAIFENMGMVQEGMDTIAKPLRNADRAMRCRSWSPRGGPRSSASPSATARSAA